MGGSVRPSLHPLVAFFKLEAPPQAEVTVQMAPGLRAGGRSSGRSNKSPCLPFSGRREPIPYRLSVRTCAHNFNLPYGVFPPRSRRVICVRTVRIVPSINSHWVAADGRERVRPRTVRIVGYRPQGRCRERVDRICFWFGRGRRGRCGRTFHPVFSRRTAQDGSDVDGAGPPSSLTFEYDLDTDFAQRGRRSTQPARKRPSAIRPGFGLCNPLARHFRKGALKVRGGSRPLRPRQHQGPYSRGDRVGVEQHAAARQSR